MQLCGEALNWHYGPGPKVGYLRIVSCFGSSSQPSSQFVVQNWHYGPGPTCRSIGVGECCRVGRRWYVDAREETGNSAPITCLVRVWSREGVTGQERKVGEARRMVRGPAILAQSCSDSCNSLNNSFCFWTTSAEVSPLRKSIVSLT